MGQLIIGVDLGQLSDPTAVVIVDASVESRDVVHIERWTGVAYPEQVARLGQLLDKLKGQWPSLVVDATGVGRAVVDLLRPVAAARGVDFAAVTITAGADARHDCDEWRVPKKDLVGAAQVVLQTGELRIASSLAHAQTLASELLSFKVTINDRGHPSYGNGTSWRDAEHDDLVLALALALWDADRRTSSNWGYVPVDMLAALGKRKF